MSDYILISGDQVNFLPPFGPAIVIVQPGEITGTGKGTIGGKEICVDGDETKVKVEGCKYTSPPFMTAGTGTLKIMQLAPNQVATKTKSDGKAVLLKGASFIAVFEVQEAAKQTAPLQPTMDPMPKYFGGSGSFVPANTTFKGE